MTLATDLVTTSNVDPEVAAAMATFERMKPLKDALGLQTLTDAEMQLFAMVCNHTGLDPFTRQIHAVKRDGKVNHQTGIDGYRSTAERMTGQYAGSDEATFEECDCGKEPAGHPSIARVVVNRILPSGHVVNQVGIARWHELYTGGAEQFMWKKMPFNQLAKCAEANGLRKAFPRVLGGVYIDEEMQHGETIDGTAREVAPTARERIAARRAAVQVVSQPPVEDDVDPDEVAAAAYAAAIDTAVAVQPAVCGDEDASPMAVGLCGLPAGHSGAHKNGNGSWPR